MTTATAPSTLDLRELPARDRHARVVSTFESLAPAGSFVLVNDHDPRPLLRDFQADRKGTFEWSPLEAGPEVWRVEIHRRAADVGSPRAITEALAWDHDRLDALDQATFAARAAGDLETAKELWAKFAFGLDRHIRFEEELLFPEFERRTGMPATAGPTAVMRHEHVIIRELLAALVATVGEPGPAADALRAQVHQVLGEHNMKEEQILYPTADRTMSPAEADAFVASIQAFA